MIRIVRALSAVLVVLSAATAVRADEVRVKDLGRFLGWRDNPLVGYGIVVGLGGSGDSPRSEVTRQALKNALSRLGANVPLDDVQSRNVAAVIVTATLPPAASMGDHIDVTVSSIGDARSLVGGTLLMTPLLGPDQKVYALAQGALVVGGYRFDTAVNIQQKNYPTSAILPGGASVETPIGADLLRGQKQLVFLLKDADFTTAERVAQGINYQVGGDIARVRDAEAVTIDTAGYEGNLYGLISRVENVAVTPDAPARIVVNERSGTVVAGGNVRISSVVISQGDIKVTVSVDRDSPNALIGTETNLRSLIVANTKLEVSQPAKDAVIRFPDTTVAELVEGLSRLHVDTRGVIAVLQSIKAAGALHADIIVQ